MSTKPITSSSLSTAPTSASTSSTTSASASSMTSVSESASSIMPASASASALQSHPAQQPSVPYDPESHLYNYDSDSDEVTPRTAEQFNLLRQAQTLAPLRLKVVSLETILEGLNIPKADWDNHIFGAQQFYVIESRGEIEPRVFKAQGECLIKNGKVPGSLYEFIVQLELLLSKSDRERLLVLGNSSTEGSASSTSAASGSSLSTPASASTSSTTMTSASASSLSTSASASVSSTMSAAESASLQSGPGLKTIESILKSLQVPENFWSTHILGVKLYFKNRTNFKNYSNLIKLQSACVEKTYNSPYAIETLIKRLDTIISPSERGLFLQNLSKEEDEEKGNK